MSSGPDDKTRQLVLERDHFRCQLCGEQVTEYWPGYSLQHRVARGMGGSKQKWKNSPANLITLCGSATTGCHGFVESNPSEALRMGFRVPQSIAPERVPVSTWQGWVYLLPDGTTEQADDGPDPGEAVA